MQTGIAELGDPFTGFDDDNFEIVGLGVDGLNIYQKN